VSRGVAYVERSGRNLRDPYSSRNGDTVCGYLTTSGETQEQGKPKPKSPFEAGKPTQQKEGWLKAVGESDPSIVL